MSTASAFQEVFDSPFTTPFERIFASTGGGGETYLTAANLVSNTAGLTGTQFQNKLANLGYLAGDMAQFQADVNAGNVITLASFNAASTTYP